MFNYTDFDLWEVKLERLGNWKLMRRNLINLVDVFWAPDSVKERLVFTMCLLDEIVGWDMAVIILNNWRFVDLFPLDYSDVSFDRLNLFLNNGERSMVETVLSEISFFHLYCC